MNDQLVLDADQRQSILGAVLARLQAHYVFPDVAAAMDAAIRARMQGGDYDLISDPVVFHETLTAHLREVCHDRHVRLAYYPEPQPPRDNLYADAEALAEYWAEAALANYGYARAERLPGNIGYLRVDALDEAEMTAETIAAAMRFVGHTFGLILDLRQNSGGASTGVAFLCSYLFPPEPVHLNDIYYREGERIQQYWTLPVLPGPRYGPGPVYVLTSRRTFSAGEELAYNLQALGRATIVGEVTAGGANPVDVYQVHPHFAIRVPTCRAINPITKTNWEGVGVQPDLAAAAEDALAVAYRAALAQAAAHYAAQSTPAFRNLRAEIDRALSALDGDGLAAITA